jgi:hypothetical protein
MEVPVYVFSLMKMARLHQVRWLREASFLLTLGLGFAAGSAVSVAAKIIYPSL